MHNSHLTLTCIFACLFIISISGCGADDSDDQTAEPVNSPPIVRKLILPDEFAPEETIELQIIAHDPDNDPLSYTWHVTAGKLDSTTASTVKWTTPSNVRSVTITVRVNDRPDSAITRSKTVTYIPERLPDRQMESIIPGKQAAGIKLGDPFDTVKAIYGKQDNPIDQSGFFAYWDNNIGLSGFVNDDNTVNSLFIRRPNKSKTPGGIGIGNSLKQVEDEFGPAEEINIPNNTHWYRVRGISFDYDANSRVERIHIFTPIPAAPAKTVPLLRQEKRQQAVKDSSLYQRRHRKTNTFSR